MPSTTLDHKSAAAAVPPSRGSNSNSRYRDDPDAVSMHTTRSDYEYDDVPELPSYDESVSGDNAAQTGTNRADNASPPPQDEYAVITQRPTNWRSRDKAASTYTAVGAETSIRMDDRLLASQNLYEYITNYLRVIPPRPSVRIQGWHYETRQKEKNKKETERVYDFDVVLSLAAYLPMYTDGDDTWLALQTPQNGDKRHRGSVFKARAPGYKQDIEVGSEAPDLKAWCQDFCESKSALKVFRVSREVTGLDTDAIKASLEPLVRTTHYRGHVDITFPVADRNVDIYTPHWVNRARLSWVRWIFYLTFLWIFTWPILFFMTKKWNVYNVQWRFSKVGPVPGQGPNVKTYATISEGAWVSRHSALIRSLVLDKFHGDGTDMPVNVDVNGQMRRASGEVPQTGNQNVDAAVNFIQGGLSAWNTLNGRSIESGWGADN